MSNRFNIFKSNNFANLFNDIRTYAYGVGANGGFIIKNRDGKLNRLASSGNGSEHSLEVLADPHAQSCFDRLLEIIAIARPVLVPGGNRPVDQRCFEFIKENYIEKKYLFEPALESLALSKITGIAGHENNYGLSKGKIIVKNIIPVDTSRFLFSQSPEDSTEVLRILTISKPYEGEVAPDQKIVYHKYYSVYINNPYGLGVGSQLIDLITFKNRCLELWLAIAETYSTPIKIGKVPDSAEPQEIDDFFKHLKNMTQNATYVLPPDFDLSVVDVSASGVESLIKTLIDYIDERISSLILGEHVTGREIANGAQARDIVASQIARRKAMSLANGLAATLNDTTIKWLSNMNYPEAEPPVLSFEFEDDLAAKADLLFKVKSLGVEFDEDWLAKEFGVKLSQKQQLGDNI